MAKKKEMNRTAGTAKRKISQAEEVRFGMKTGKPLTGSASGVKSISLKQAGEALTQGIVTTRGGKLQFAPEGLAMALPLGKVAKAAKVFRAAGKTRVAAALESRLKAKSAGNLLARDLSPKREPGTGVAGFLYGYGKTDRAASGSIFPRVGGAGTTVRRGRGTVNQKGLESMIAGGREPSREMLRIPQILKGTNEAYESIAQKAIKAAGKTPKRPRGK